MTPDRSFAAEVMAMNLVPYMRALQKLDAIFTVTYRLEAVQRGDNGLVAIVGSDYGGVRKGRDCDQGLGQPGHIPLDDHYVTLKPQHTTLGFLEHGPIPTSER